MADCPTCGESFERGMIDRVVNASHTTVGYFCNVCASKFPPDPVWPTCPACGSTSIVVQGTTEVDAEPGGTSVGTQLHCAACTYRFPAEAVAD